MTRRGPGTLVLRADAGTEIGLGHVLRCLALAERCLDGEGQAFFLTHCENDAVRRRIESVGATFIPLARPYPDPEDLERTLEVTTQTHARVPRDGPPWVVVDGYHFDPKYQEAIREHGSPLLVIDDMAHQDRYDADVLLNQNANAEELAYRTNEEAVRLLGTRYVLLRREFTRRQGQQRTIPRAPRRVLITLGGSDPGNATLTVLNGLFDIRGARLDVRVIVGPANPHLHVLEQIIASNDSGHKIELMQRVSDMPVQMAWADVAISAGGSTCWELAYMGVPSIVLVLAENQRGITEALEKIGVSINLGWHSDVRASRLAAVLESLLHDQVRRKEMSDWGRALVDGLGAQRVLDVLVNTGRRFHAHPVSRQ